MSRTPPPPGIPPESHLRPGNYVYWGNTIYTVLPSESNDPFSICLADIDTNEKRIVCYDDLILNQDDESKPIFARSLQKLHAEINRRTAPPANVPGTSLPNYAYAFADHLIASVVGVEHILEQMRGQAVLTGTTFRQTDALRIACTRLDEPIGLSTYYLYKKLYDQYDRDRVQLASYFRRNSYGKWKITQQQLHFVDTIIARYYTRHERPRPMTLYKFAQAHLEHTKGLWPDPTKCGPTVPRDLVRELLDRKIPLQAIIANPEKQAVLTPVKLPSKAWLYPYLQWFRSQPNLGRQVIEKQLGQNVWEDEHLVFDTFVARAQFPLQYVFSDHWLFDVLIVDEETRSKVKRLWLTVLIDAFTRCVLGFALLHESPCTESILSALQHAIYPKTSHTALGLEGEWPCCGIPQRLFLDNAWAHHSHSLERLAHAISDGHRYQAIELDWRPPYKGRYGNIIEALFGNLSAEIKELLPGALRGSTPAEKRNAVQEACLLYQDIWAIMHKVILRYQRTTHSALAGLTPNQAWMAGLQSGPPLIPPFTSSVERLFWRKYPQTRPITAHGVSLFGLHYMAPALRHARSVDRDGKPLRYDISYQPSDIHRIALFHSTTWLCDAYAKELKLADNSYLHVSLAELTMAKQLAADDGRATTDLLDYRDYVRHLAQQRTHEKREAQRQNGAKPARRPSSLPSNEDVQAAVASIAASRDEDDKATDYLRAFAKETGGR